MSKVDYFDDFDFTRNKYIYEWRMENNKEIDNNELYEILLNIECFYIEFTYIKRYEEYNCLLYIDELIYNFDTEINHLNSSSRFTDFTARYSEKCTGVTFFRKNDEGKIMSFRCYSKKGESNKKCYICIEDGVVLLKFDKKTSIENDEKFIVKEFKISVSKDHDELIKDRLKKREEKENVRINNKLDHYNIFVIGKYASTFKDLVNIEKSCKEYRGIIEQYHFNPINIVEKEYEHYGSIEMLNIYDYQPFLEKRAGDNDRWIYPIKDYLKTVNPGIKIIVFERKVIVGELIEIMKSVLDDYKKFRDIEFKFKYVYSMDCNALSQFIESGLTRAQINLIVNTYPNKTKLEQRSEIAKIRFKDIVKLTVEHYEVEVRHQYLSLKHPIVNLRDLEIKKLTGYYERTLDLTSVQLPSKIEVLGEKLFSSCNNLESVNIPRSVSIIESMCFSNCSILKSIELPENLMIIEKKAFYNCTELSKINIPSSLSIIGSKCFLNCKKLNEITLDSVVTKKDIKNNDNITRKILIENGFVYYSDGKAIFYFRNNLNRIEIPTYIKSLPSHLFYNHDEIQEIKMHDNIEFIGKGCFNFCTNLTSINLKAKELRTRYLFKECLSLTTIKIPKHVSKLEEGSFICCYNLKNIEGLENVKIIEPSSFSDCYNLESINIPNVVNIPESCFQSCYNLKTVKLSSNLRSIGKCAFFTCTELSRIELPSTITSIESYAFKSCSKLTFINLPEGLFSIGEECFSNCSSLVEITVPSTVTSIGEKCFEYCENLTFACLNASIENLPTQSFFSCKALKNIELSTTIKRLEDGAFRGCFSLGNLVLPENIEIISDRCFSNCKLNNITFNEKITGIYNSCFECCDLNEIKIPDSVSTLCEFCFSRCTNLTSVTLSTSIEGLGTGLFSNCFNLIRIDIPTNISVIESFCFENCTSIKTIIIPSSVTFLGNGCFKNCFSLKNVIIKGNIKKLPFQCFLNCITLTDIVMPSSVYSIHAECFKGCINQKELILPKSIKNIHRDCFSECLIEKIIVPESIKSIHPSNTQLFVYENGKECDSVVFSDYNFSNDEDPIIGL